MILFISALVMRDGDPSLQSLVSQSQCLCWAYPQLLVHFCPWSSQAPTVPWHFGFWCAHWSWLPTQSYPDQGSIETVLWRAMVHIKWLSCWWSCNVQIKLFSARRYCWLTKFLPQFNIAFGNHFLHSMLNASPNAEGWCIRSTSKRRVIDEGVKQF